MNSKQTSTHAQKRAEEALSQGWQFQNTGQLEQAAEQYRTALRHDPENPNAMHLLGLVTHLMGDSNGACNLIRGAIGLKSNDAAYHVNLSMILDSLGRFEEAIKHNQNAIKLNPKHVGARFGLANDLRLQGNLDDAIVAYGEALTLAPDRGDIWSNYGSTLEANGNHREAVVVLRKAVALSPNAPGIWSNLGNALRSCEQFDDAVDAYENALKLDPNNVDTHINLGLAHLHHGRFVESLQQFGQCLAVEPCNRSALAFKGLIEAQRSDTNLLDYENSIKRELISLPNGYENLAEFNQALCHQVLVNKTLKWEPSGKSTYGGRQSDNLLAEASGAILALTTVIESFLKAYLARPPLIQSHPYQTKIIPGFDLNVWATILESQGQQRPHIHPGGWLSGVYYAQIPKDLGASPHSGWIEFGQPPEEVARHLPDPKTHCIKPEEGHLLIFPSYFFHRTIPFINDLSRISIAFDLIPHE